MKNITDILNNVAQKHPELRAFASTLVSNPVKGDSDRVNKTQSVVETLKGFGLDITDTVGNSQEFQDALVDAVLQLAVKFETLVSTLNSDEFDYIDLNTDDITLSRQYDIMESDFESKVSNRSVSQLLGDFSDVEYWAKLSREKRIIHALVLIRLSHELNFEPHEIWRLTYGTNGTQYEV